SKQPQGVYLIANRVERHQGQANWRRTRDALSHRRLSLKLLQVAMVEITGQHYSANIAKCIFFRNRRRVAADNNSDFRFMDNRVPGDCLATGRRHCIWPPKTLRHLRIRNRGFRTSQGISWSVEIWGGSAWGLSNKRRFVIAADADHTGATRKR